ncbi:flagellar basal-body rod protein FlgG [Bacillota bacterium]
MIRGFYTATSGLISQQTNLNVIANNIANTNTIGFKPQHSDFSSLIHAKLNGGAANQISAGHGVKVEKTDIDFTQGSLVKTDMPYDYTIIGEGFFALESKEGGDISYTRNGSFQIVMDGKKSYLGDGSGNFVLDSKDKKIEITDKYDYKQIGVFAFPNRYGLAQTAGSRFNETELSGEAEAVKSPEIKQGFLENSGVQLSLEMVKMIEASKSFSFGSKLVQTADEMEKTINQLR